jgi:putative ABC transport system permease protein
MIVVKQGYDINLVAQQIKFQLSKQDVVDKFVVMTPDTIKKLAGDILSIVELALIMIAMVSLLVGAVGIMNTMYTSVLERTKQIGIMKAIGASSESILGLFLIESGVIGIIGGVIGIIGGISLAIIAGVAASSFAGITGLFSFASLDYLGFLVVLVVTLMTGIIAGILPARQAASMEPAEALRYE